MLSKRNQIPMNDVLALSDDIDTIYETCDAEFNSRIDVYRSFKTARGKKSWARYYLLHEVQKICQRDGIYMSQFHCQNIADRISDDWYKHDCREEKTYIG